MAVGSEASIVMFVMYRSQQKVEGVLEKKQMPESFDCAMLNLYGLTAHTCYEAMHRVLLSCDLGSADGRTFGQV